MENEICTITYIQKTDDANAVIIEVKFNKECSFQMVTVCQQQPGYGHKVYGHDSCQEVAKQTCYNTPEVIPMSPPVQVTYSESSRTCVKKHISLPIISCEDVVSESCVTVPDVEEGMDEAEICITQLTAPACSTVELSLPKQVCKEIIYTSHPPPPPPPSYPY